MVRSFLASVGVVVVAAASGSAQVNLLANGSFEENNGFSELAGQSGVFDTAYNFGGFQGWPGWASDFDDDGLRNGTYDENAGLPGGFMFFNLFPAGGDNASQPVLTGTSSGIGLGPFDGNTTSFAWQQVAVTPGDTLRATVWARQQSDALNFEGNPEPTIFASQENQFGHSIEFIDPVTGGVDIFLDPPPVEIIFDAATQTIEQVDMTWIENVIEFTVPTGASLLRQTLFFNQFNNQPGVAFFDNASLVNLSTGTPLEGDLDYDGELTSDDVRILELGVAGELAVDSVGRFDLSSNGVIDQADLDLLNELVGPSLEGDINGDGVVDVLDLDILGTNFGASPATLGQGDLNGDNVVDVLDLDILGTNFGATAAAAAAVPEPTALLLLAPALFAAVRRR